MSSEQTRWDRKTETYVLDHRQSWSFTITTRIRGTREQAGAYYDRYQQFLEGGGLDGICDALPNTVCTISSKIEPGDLTIEAYEKTKSAA